MSRPTTTADTTPISPTRFAAALPPLSLPTLHLKVLEIRNSISHLRTSNIQLLPYALGTDPPGSTPDPDCADAIRENEAVIVRMDERIALIRTEVENRGCSWREFEASDVDASGTAAADADVDADVAPVTNGLRDARIEEERIAGERHPAWSDGTFRMGTIRGGVLQYDDEAPAAAAATGVGHGASGNATSGTASTAGNANAATTNAGSVSDTLTATASTTAASGGRLDDEQLRRAMEERMRETDNDDDDDGLHL
ncbi:hypothetical protein ACHAQH_004665 [Verticillium albo-atrum]